MKNGQPIAAAEERDGTRLAVTPRCGLSSGKLLQSFFA